VKRLIATIALLPVLLAGCTNGNAIIEGLLYPAPDYNKEVEIVDAFCTYGETSYFYFNFTLQNSKNEDIEISYQWTLNDPAADNPGAQEGVNDPAARMYEGQGTASLTASGTSQVQIKIEETRDYDPRYYVMYVSVYRDGDLVGYYREQKSTYDWDYSVTPPVYRSQKPVYIHLWIDTYITREAQGYRVTISDLIFLPPDRTCSLGLGNIAVTLSTQDADSERPLALSGIIQPEAGAPYGLQFYDADGSNTVSIGDYFTVDESAEGAEIELSSLNEPSIHIHEIGHREETIEEESQDAIRIIDVSYELSAEYVDFYIEVDSPNIQDYIGNNSVRLIHPGERGWSEWGVGNQDPPLSAQGSTYGGRIDLSNFKSESRPLYLVIYLTDDINEVFCKVCEIP